MAMGSVRDVEPILMNAVVVKIAKPISHQKIIQVN